jgi:photosystem II stability/assembly factor-like uncharacterized protein
MVQGCNFLISRLTRVCALLILLLSSISVLAVAPSVSMPWVPFGPDGGDARRIVPDPRNPMHLYLGTANGWIYESHDGGGNWARLAQLGKRDDLVLDSIIVDAKNPLHLIVGTWVIDRPDGGLYLSNDGGITWAVQAEMRGQSILSMAASASDPRIMVAGTMRGVFRTRDGGQRWSRISPDASTEIHNVQSVAIDPKDPNVVYAGTWHLPWKTIDGGEHWDNIKQGIIDDSDVFSIIVDPIKSQSVFASACSGIYKSEDGGLEFHKIQGIPSSARRTRRLLQDPHNPDRVFAGTTEGLFRSDDGGTTWIRTTGPEYIVNDVEVDLANSNHILLATDRGGVLASEDGGDTFHTSNNGFSSRQVSALKRDDRHPETLFVGVVNDKGWGGVFESENGGQNWMQRSDGLAGRDVFALGQASDGTIIAGTSHGIFRLSDAEKTWIPVESAPAGPVHPDVAAALLRRTAGSTLNPFHTVHPTKLVSGKQRSKSTSASRRNANLKARPGSKQGVTRRASTAKGKAAGKRRTILVKGKHSAKAKPNHVAVAVARVPGKQAVPAPDSTLTQLVPPAAPKVFDGSVYGIATSGQTLVATTSIGLLTSQDNGLNWLASGPAGSEDWRFLAAAQRNVIAASLHSLYVSADSGLAWSAVRMPEGLTQIATVAIEPGGAMWVGGREGIYVTSDGGATWAIPKNLFLNSVNNIYFDEASNRLTVTTSGNSSLVFSVQLPDRAVSFTDTGWNLRFVRQVGDHMVAATLFDGIVVQPRMVASPMHSDKTANVPMPTTIGTIQSASHPEPSKP